VSPSASERLATEAKSEGKSRWTTHWTIQASAMTTFLAGIMANSDPGAKSTKAGEEAPIKFASTMATYVGGLWLIGTGVMSATYSPYQKGMSEMKSLAQGSKKEKLAYERYAEESLYAPSRIATVMKWTSFVSNLGANAMVMSNAYNPMTKFMGTMGILTSFAPVFFEHPWNEVYHFQSDYKKRIYGSFTSMDVSILPNGQGGMAGVAQLAYQF
jgi:hypothetical protein